ncbi:MAG: hypothetical protein IH852_08405 [Bacteroidetes bacterium]|nr:hypothetical protein [Bacteroidota bacterium]
MLRQAQHRLTQGDGRSETKELGLACISIFAKATVDKSLRRAGMRS